MTLFELPDVDFDVQGRDKIIGYFPDATIASQLQARTELVRHKDGIYFQHIPRDPETGLAAFPYNVAEDLGYFKVDLLSSRLYDGIKDSAHFDELIRRAEDETRFPWIAFQDDQFYADTNPDPDWHLYQLGNRHDVIRLYPPESIGQLAILNALIRPRKSYLIGKDWGIIEEKIWRKLPEENQDEYVYKKSHSIAYALNVLIDLQLKLNRLGIYLDY